MAGTLIPMPTAWQPTHLFKLECGHHIWVTWPDAPGEIWEGRASCSLCGQAGRLLVSWWRIR